MDVRLLSVAGAFWLGAIGALVLGTGPVLALTATTALAVAAWVRVRLRVVGRERALYWAPHVATCLLAVAAAALVTAAWQEARGGHLASLSRSGALATVTGRISGYPSISDNVYRTMRVETVTGRGTRSPAAASVRLVGDDDLADIPLHAELTAVVRLEPTDGTDEILAWARVVRIEAVRHPSGIPGVVARHAAALRTNLVGASPAARGLVPGLGIGDDSALPEESARAMKVVNLTHLTAVSGAHVSMVTALVLAAVSGRRRRTAALSSAAVLALLVVATGAAPSVLRAAIMGGVVLAATWLRRPASALPALALAITVLLALNPGLALSYGFALSALSTGAIVAFATPAAALLEPLAGRVGASMLAVPIVAHLACGPIVATLSPTASLWSALANLVAAPAVPAGTILSLAALILAPVPLAGPALAITAGWVVSWIDVVARAAASLPGSGVGAGIVMVSYVGVLAAAWAVGRGLVSRRHLLGAGLALGSLALLPSRTGDWDVVVCDVGQGSAALVRDGGVVYLVDTGMAEERLPECVERAGARVDVVIVSHPHSDHDGNLAWVIERFDPLVWVGPGMKPTYAHLTERIEEVAAGERRGGMEVLWPERARACADSACVNDQSIVVRANLDQRMLLTGDIEREAQRALAGRDVASDIVVVPHHGSATQVEAFATAVGAHTAIISVGENTFGHPADSAIELYAPTGSLHRTDDTGDIVLALDVGY